MFLRKKFDLYKRYKLVQETTKYRPEFTGMCHQIKWAEKTKKIEQILNIE